MASGGREPVEIRRRRPEGVFDHLAPDPVDQARDPVRVIPPSFTEEIEVLVALDLL